MHLRPFLESLVRVLVPFAFLATTYLYLYPIFHGCAFPSTNRSGTTAFRSTFQQHVRPLVGPSAPADAQLAPFRLLVLADPQLEGDSSLPDPENGFFHRLAGHWARLKNGPTLANMDTASDILQTLLFRDIPEALQALRKRLDLFGNDFYLAHIYRTMHWWAKPTHITVLGDLIGSQWVDDEEFEWRGWRYWNRVFTGGERIDDSITHQYQQEGEKLLNMDDEAWQRRIVNIAGNHDIGYAGDISKSRIERFERVFGKANWDVRLQYPMPSNGVESSSGRPTLHVVVLNDLNLDTPALDEELQGQTYEYLNSLITDRVRPVEDPFDFTLVLTHVPLHKKAGVCVDSPLFDFWGSDDGGGAYKPHGVKEQYHLSDHASHSGVLEALFGMSGNMEAPAQGKGRNGLILTGHDHEGCDVWHYIPRNSTIHGTSEEKESTTTVWEASRWEETDMDAAHTGIREVTLRSMMGDFGGNAGLLSAWFDFGEKEWKYDIVMCKLGVQHIWWAIHTLDLVAIALAVLLLMGRYARSPTSNESMVSGPPLRVKGTKQE